MRRCLGLLLLGILLLTVPLEGKAADAKMVHSRIKIRNASGFGVLLIVKDFWDTPIWWDLVRTPEGRADYPWEARIGTTRCPSPCKAVAVDLTREEYATIANEVRLRRLEEDLNTIRSQLRELCSRLRRGC